MSSSRAGGDVVLNGSDFRTHVIFANEGEDIAMEIMSLFRRGSRAICILSAHGAISNVTLRHTSVSRDTLTYEGTFELVTLRGTLVPAGNGISRTNCDGITVTFAGPGGQLKAGALAGSLVAGGPVQVVIATFEVNNISDDFSNHEGSVDYEAHLARSNPRQSGA